MTTRLVGGIGLFVAALAGAQPLRWKNLHPGSRTGDLRSVSARKSLAPGRSHFLLQFRNSPAAGQRTELADRGVSLLTYVPDWGFTASAGRDVSLDGLDVQWAGSLEPGEKISSRLYPEDVALVEFFRDVSPDDARAITVQTGLTIHENPDLLPNHLLVSGPPGQIAALADWDEVAYIFPASDDLVRGSPVHGCAGALTAQGQVGQAIAIVGDGWDGPGRGAADLQFAFGHLTEKLPADGAQVEIARALSEWTKYVKISFTQTSNLGVARALDIRFASGAHGDGYPFDGRGGVVAHTFYPFPVNPEPIAGDMHFDEDEAWAIGGPAIDLFSIALHEAGHALGLGHSDSPADVMYPYYRKMVSLSPNDIAAVRQIYAAQDENSPPAALQLTVQEPTSPTTADSIAITGSTSGGGGGTVVTWRSGAGHAGTAQGSLIWLIPAVPLIAGDNEITITARDSRQDQVSQGITVNRRLPDSPPVKPTGPDKTAPSLAILSPATATFTTSAASIVISGTAKDPAGVAVVTWSSSGGGAGVASGTENWSTPAIPLYLGSTMITIRATDAAGNTAWRSLSVTRR